MISGVRDNALALACLRYGLPVVHASGIDILPRQVAAQFEESLVRQIEIKELSRAHRVVIGRLLNEIRIADSDHGPSGP